MPTSTATANSPVPPEPDVLGAPQTDAPPDSKPSGLASDEPSPVTAVETKPPAVDSPEPPEFERLLLLWPTGPLLCDVSFSIEGKSHRQAVQELTSSILRIADTDQDGVVTWQEATTNPRLRYGQFGNDRIQDQNQGQQVVYRCDINRNDRLDENELAIFLAPQERASHWINIVDSLPGEDTPEEWIVFNWLDANRDDLLDQPELDQAAQRLRMLDHDDDGTLTPNDFPGGVSSPPRERPYTNSAQVVWLQPDTDWSRILFLLEDRYSLGSPLQPGDLLDCDLLWETLDANGDGTWDSQEVSQLLTYAADFQVCTEYRASAAWLDVHVPESSSLTSTRKGNADAGVCLPSGELRLAVRDRPVDGPSPADWERLWSTWDADRDNVLSEKEYGAAEPVLQLPLNVADADGNGQLEAAEGLEILRQRLLPRSVQLRIALRPGVALAWNYLDADQDNRLTERELRTSSTRLRELAQSSSGLRRQDFPVTETLVIQRAGRTQTSATPSDPGDPNPSPPTWFLQMDLNGDGEISRREFLGDPSRLLEWDQNDDGSLQIGELPSAPKDVPRDEPLSGGD